MKLTFISHAILIAELSQFVHVTHKTVRVRVTFAAVMPAFLQNSDCYQVYQFTDVTDMTLVLDQEGLV
jgi:hypothetical protein